MITSFHQVDLEFYKQFLGEDLKTPFMEVTTHKMETIQVPVKYVKKSARDLTEENDEKYPMITIENFTPKIVPDYYYPEQTYYANPRQAIVDEITYDLITEYFAQVPFDFRFEVSIAADSESEWDALKLQFAKLFSVNKQKYFVFNKFSVPLEGNLGTDSDVGDVVGYTLEIQEVNRTDGVFETVYVFVVRAWVQLTEPKDLLTASSIGVALNVVDSVTGEAVNIDNVNIL